MTLHQQAVHHGSDKGTAHKYCDFYESRIGEPKRIIEFGVLNGASLKMWRDHYQEAVVIGLDIEEKKAPIGTYVFKLDASKENWITKLQPSFDLILDDASHMTMEQIMAFELWWPLVAKGGHYIIEDVHTMGYSQYNPSGFNLRNWVEKTGIKHEYFWRIPGDFSDSGTLMFYK